MKTGLERGRSEQMLIFITRPSLLSVLSQWGLFHGVPYYTACVCLPIMILKQYLNVVQLNRASKTLVNGDREMRKLAGLPQDRKVQWIAWNNKSEWVSLYLSALNGVKSLDQQTQIIFDNMILGGCCKKYYCVWTLIPRICLGGLVEFGRMEDCISLFVWESYILQVNHPARIEVC